jgi:hypothetical protein
VDVQIEQPPRVRAYRRLVTGMSIALGVSLGLGLAGLAVLASSPWPMLILGILLGIRVIGSLSGRLTFPHRANGWLWPIVALVVAAPLLLVLPAGLAPICLAIAVALWFTTLIAAGILEVVVDPEGRLGL